MDENIFVRSEMLIGSDKLRELEKSHVILFGLGGVGSFAAEILARCGVGALTLVDSDTVSESNRNRQLYALSSTMGRLKTDVARERILDINPSCRVSVVSEFYLPDNGDSFFTEQYSFIADAIDTVSAKIDLVLQAQKREIPIISCMGTGNKLDPSHLRVSDIYSTGVCPLCRVMRHELRKRNIASLKVVWSDEEPIKVCTKVPDGSHGRNVPGSVAFVPPTAGVLMAREIIFGLTDSAH